MKIINYIKANSISVAIALMLLAFFGYRHLTTYLNHSVLMDKPAPAFTLNDTNGKEWTFSAENTQKKTLLVFWATWCGVCKTEIGDLVKLEKSLNKNKFQLLTIVIPDNETSAEIRKFSHRHKINYTVLIDDSGVYRDYLVQGFPTKYWIENDGTISDYDIGKNIGLSTQVKRWIDG